jgi:hypothetical protein
LYPGDYLIKVNEINVIKSKLNIEEIYALLDKVDVTNLLIFTCELSMHDQTQIIKEVAIDIMKSEINIAQKYLQANVNQVNNYNSQYRKVRDNVIALKDAVQTGKIVESVQLPNAAAKKRLKKRKKAEPTIQNNNMTTSEVASTNDNYRQGRWTKEEKDRFLLGLEQHGNDLRAIQLMIPTRSLKQITGHAANLAKSQAGEEVQALKRRKKNTSRKTGKYL